MLTRKDLKHQEYYKTLADVIGIFWVFHKMRLQSLSSPVPFAWIYSFKQKDSAKKIIPFDPEEMMSMYIQNIQQPDIRIIEKFGEAVLMSLEFSSYQFFEMIQRSGLSSEFEQFPIDDAIKKIFMCIDLQAYISSLVDKAQKLGKDISRFSILEEYDLRKVIPAGMNTGSEMTTQLSALMGEEFNTVVSIIVSKVSLNSLKQVRAEIGMTRTRVGSHEGNPQYNLLLRDSRFGINQALLREYGYGEAVGCPASLPISKETRKILKEYGLKAPRTMLEDFAKMVDEEFQRIRVWFNNLSEDERKRLHPEDVRILSGAVWEQVARLEGNGCPMRRSKESL